MPGNVFLHELKHDLVSQVSHAAGIASLHERNRFTLIIRRLAETFVREGEYEDENRARPKVKKFHFTSVHLLAFSVSGNVDPYVNDKTMSIELKLSRM